jgi:type III restriction enzyme
VRVNPSAFLDGVTSAITAALHAQLADRIEYVPVSGERWEAQQFVDHVGYAYDKTVIVVKKSITSMIQVDSQVEREFAEALDARPDVKLFLKLPSWFKVPTPLGGYNPDWAIVQEKPEGHYLYLVRETKGGSVLEELRFEHEQLKIKCGRAHFKAIKVDYAFGVNVGHLLDGDLDPNTSSA